MKQLEIINACSDLGVCIDGTSLGPNLISQYFYKNNNVKQITSIQNKIVTKNKDKNNLKKNLDEINLFDKELYKVAFKCLDNEHFPIVIGGDHSVAIASSLASLNKYDNLGLIWVDAHADFNTFETTRTGNIHGLPLAAICGYKNEELTLFLTKKYFNTKNVVIVGARSIDDWEYPNLNDTNVTIFTTKDIKQYGVETVMNKAIAIAGNNTNGIHISYDLDLIDPACAPGVSVPEVDGINENEAYDIMKIITNNKDKIKSLDLVEYNPNYDVNYKTLDIAIHLLDIFINNKV